MINIIYKKSSFFFNNYIILFLQVSLSENILENELFKQKLKESKDKIQSILVQENEEQLQCLNLQLQTLKASCQCIQEENRKLQESYNVKFIYMNLKLY